MAHRKVQDLAISKIGIAMVDYAAQEPGELTLRKGDRVEGTYKTVMLKTDGGCDTSHRAQKSGYVLKLDYYTE